MTPPRIQLIHAVTGSVDPIHDAFARLWPGAVHVDLTDTSLATDLEAAGELTDDFARRMTALVRYGIDCGADAVLFTCSAFGTAIEASRVGVDIPVLKPDEAMIEAALAIGPRIGGLATFGPTIPSLARELENAAEARGLNPEITLHHVADAFQALKGGDAAKHNSHVAKAAAEMTDVDVLILAQYTMVQAMGDIAEVAGRPVLAAPDEAVKKLRKLLGG
ncbi:MAG: arylsulfatase [Rhodospirillales bacterium]|nr:arylsulfatase [Rhodospirillales bacterium]